MLKDRITNLFANYDPTIRAVIAEVLSIEQENISMERPRVKDEIDAVISRMASTALEQEVTKPRDGADSGGPRR